MVCFMERPGLPGCSLVISVKEHSTRTQVSRCSSWDWGCGVQGSLTTENTLTPTEAACKIAEVCREVRKYSRQNLVLTYIP